MEGLSCGKLGGPPSKAKYSWRPIVNEYREGKVKSTPVRGVKQYLKPRAYKQSEGVADLRVGSLMACLLKNEPTSYVHVARLSPRRTEPERKRV